ncbi:MAG TPA: hypothetical protein VHR88_05100 [Solirubrobacteraceae bacterium]|jgi:uncharacterized membrane protein|nr:hypothetical protein [Solirubrobacteraceae bacterium]
MPEAHPREAVRRFPQEIRSIARAEGAARRRFRNHIAVLTFYTLAIWVICSIAMYFFEHHARGTDIHNGWQAAYWTASQMTTVGSSFANPISTPAYVLDLLLKIYAVVVVATLAGSLGAFFVHRGREDQA